MHGRVAALAILVVPSGALAAEIEWRAPAECERAEVARAQVEKLVGQELSTVEGVAFEVEVTASDGGAHRVLLRTLRTGGAPREREIIGASCAEVTDAVSVAIALTIGEREHERAQEVADLPVSPRSTVSAGAPEVEPVATATEPDLRFAVGAGLLVETGALPKLAPGFELVGALEWRLLRIEAFAGMLAPQEERLPGDDRGGTFDFMIGGIDLCAKPPLSGVHLIACAGFELGRVSGQGDNVADPRLGDAGWYAPRAELGVGYDLADTVRSWLRGGVAVPLTRPEFLLEGADLVHQPRTMSLRVLLALEIVL